MIVDRRIFWVIRRVDGHPNPDYAKVEYRSEVRAMKVARQYSNWGHKLEIFRVSVITDESKVRDVVDASDH